MSVNYLLSACAHRADREDSIGIVGIDVLRLHLEQLAKTDTSKLSQITLIRALPLERGPRSNHYWNHRNWPKFNCPLVIYDVIDYYFSYSSWIQAVLKYPDFDYSILIEDDYYPAIPNFAEVLIQEHKEKLPQGGYLNSFTVDHASVSNGIVDNKSFLSGIAHKKNPIKMLSHGAQWLFGRGLFSKNLNDFTDKYRCLYRSDIIVEQTHDITLSNKIDIFRPIEYLSTGEIAFPKHVSPKLL